jgi:hypothetical protein
MTQPTACIRCHGTDLVDATLDGAAVPQLRVDGAHLSPIAARVCLTCGAVLFTAARPGALRSTPAPERNVQESDF